VKRNRPWRPPIVWREASVVASVDEHRDHSSVKLE
jgi:hypothetical protein